MLSPRKSRSEISPGPFLDGLHLLLSQLFHCWRMPPLTFGLLEEEDEILDLF
jgi:hypothetical protein